MIIFLNCSKTYLKVAFANDITIASFNIFEKSYTNLSKRNDDGDVMLKSTL